MRAEIVVGMIKRGLACRRDSDHVHLYFNLKVEGNGTYNLQSNGTQVAMEMYILHVWPDFASEMKLLGVTEFTLKNGYCYSETGELEACEQIPCDIIDSMRTCLTLHPRFMFKYVTE